jgi:hypothetical protein
LAKRNKDVRHFIPLFQQVILSVCLVEQLALTLVRFFFPAEACHLDQQNGHAAQCASDHCGVLAKVARYAFTSDQFVLYDTTVLPVTHKQNLKESGDVQLSKRSCCRQHRYGNDPLCPVPRLR